MYFGVSTVYYQMGPSNAKCTKREADNARVPPQVYKKQKVVVTKLKLKLKTFLVNSNVHCGTMGS